MLLSEANAGKTVRVVFVSLGRDTRRRLLELGIRRGSFVRRLGGFSGVVRVEHNGFVYIIEEKTARGIFVEN